jgi:hypothetical protein
MHIEELNQRLVALAATGGGGGHDGLPPYLVQVGETYTVPEYRQALFAEPITVDGTLVVDGMLIEAG